MEHSDPQPPRSHTEHQAHPYDVTPSEIEALTTEREIMGEDEKAMAERLMLQALPEATLSLIRMATMAQSESVRFGAAKYVIERNLGVLKDQNALQQGDKLQDLVGELAAARS